MTCNGCGGIVGRDCYNPRECEEISMSFNDNSWNGNTSHPHCYKTGDWDGLQSDWVLIEKQNGIPSVARCYYTEMDGSQSFDWYEGEHEYGINEEQIKRWMQIPY